MNFIISWLPTIIIFILMLGVLVLFHEAGHFLAAKKSGMDVEEFGFGFPPKVWGKKIKGTLYSINLLPLGGFVKILGENEESKSKKAFGNKSLGRRIFVVVSGVLMNFVLAYLAFIILFASSLPPLVSSASSYNGKTINGNGGLHVEIVKEGGLADKNGIKKGDFILQAGDKTNPSVLDLREEMAESKGGNIFIKIERIANDKKEIIEKNISVGEASVLDIGILEKLGKIKYTWWKIPYYAFIETVKAILFVALSILILLKDLIFNGAVSGDVLGIVGIFGITSVAVKLGFAYILSLLIVFTINLGIINILPFPALDGGRLIFLMVEKIRGKKIAQNVENIIHNIGFFILLLLLILITWRDIARF